MGYGTKPMELTELSVADYLSDFETGFAWNRILQENEDVNSLGVNTVDGYTPEATDAGYISSSRIETHYTVGEDHELTEREYVTNYYVSMGPAYRVETESEPADPRSHRDRQLGIVRSGMRDIEDIFSSRDRVKSSRRITQRQAYVGL